MSIDADHYRGNAEEAAKAKGLIVVVPTSKELFVDIDNEPSLRVFLKTLPILGDVVMGFRRAPSPSGSPFREHITVTLSRDVKDSFERIMLQLMLGSDPLHESLSWWSATRGIDNPTVFFEKPSASVPTPVPMPEIAECADDANIF